MSHFTSVILRAFLQYRFLIKIDVRQEIGRDVTAVCGDIEIRPPVMCL